MNEVKSWSYYGADGRLTGRRFIGTEDAAAEHAAAGERCIEGEWNEQCYRVEDGAVVKVAPTKPTLPDDLTDYEWSEDATRWVRVRTIAGIAADARAERTRRLDATSWIVERALEAGLPVPSEWRDYRQALRDVPAQPGFPLEIDWPEPPSS